MFNNQALEYAVSFWEHMDIVKEMIENDKDDDYYYPQWIRDAYRKEKWPRMNQSMFTPQKGSAIRDYEYCFNMWIWTIGKRKAGYWRPDRKAEMEEYQRKYPEHSGEEVPRWLQNKVGCCYDVKTPQEIEMIEEGQMLINAAIDDKIRRLRTEWESRKNPPTFEEMSKNEEKQREMLAFEYAELPLTFKTNTWKWSASSDSEDEDDEFSDDDVPFGSGRKDNDFMVFVLPPEKRVSLEQIEYSKAHKLNG
jgi:hypothetical protein